jgi:hypothetical protein
MLSSDDADVRAYIVAKPLPAPLQNIYGWADG